MGDIFSLAQKVLIWTGLDNEMKEGAKCLETLSRLVNLKAIPGPEGLLPVCVHSAPQFRYLVDSNHHCKTETLAAQTRQISEPEHTDILSGSHLQEEHTTFTVYEDHTSRWTLFSGVEKYEYDLFSKFFTRPFFVRRWIIQEVALAQEISLYCGDTVMTRNIGSAVNQLGSLPNHEWHGNDGALSFLAMLTMPERKNDRFYSPLSILREFPNLKYRDPKDHVFALLGIFKSKFKFPEHELMNTSYENSIEVIYTALAKYHLDQHLDREADGLFELLSTAGAMRINTGDESLPRLSLPSWVPDWRCSQRYIPCSSSWSLDAFTYSQLYKRTGNSCFEITRSGHLQISGFKIDNVVDCIKCNLLDPAGREVLRSRIIGWFSKEHYQIFYNSALEVISAALVTHFYDNCPPEYSSPWLMDNKRMVFDFMDQMEEYRPSEFQDFLNILPIMMRGRSLILTASGHIGISCEDSEHGDCIVTVKGGKMPFVMRNPSPNVPTSENPICTYKLIGDVYVHKLDICGSEQGFVSQSLLID
jgi:hypothetical protein